MIYFQNISKSFGSHQVLCNLNLHIEKGRITFILGKSGEGKSVTIKHIMGLLRPDSGKIMVDGQDITQLSKESLRQHRKKFGMLFQQAALFDSMTVLENVLFPLREHSSLNTRHMLTQASEVMEKTGILELKNKFPAELSTGEKKQVGLARALVARPQILLYDEPTTGMDPLVCEMIDALIVSTNKATKDLTSVVISHDLKAALTTAERIVMLYKGQVALYGKPNDFKNSKDPIVRQFFSGRVDGPMEFL